MNAQSVSTLLTFLNELVNYTIKDDKPACNGYIGINTKCDYCKKVPGEHYHFLDTSNNGGPYYDMNTTGVMCSYCEAHPGEKHYHKDCK